MGALTATIIMRKMKMRINYRETLNPNPGSPAGAARGMSLVTR